MERHFEMPLGFQRENWIYVLERGWDRGATAVDFFEIRSAGHYWRRSDDFSREPTPPPPRISMKFNRRPLGIALGTRGGGVDCVDVEIPPGALFQASVGIYAMTTESEFHEHPLGTRLVVSLARETGGFERLHEQVVLNTKLARLTGKNWTHLELDLAAYAGETVTLRMELEADRKLKPDLLSWWGNPRIALRPVGE